MTTETPASVGEILEFWFRPAHAVHWFAADALFDQEIRRRFGPTVEAAVQSRLDDWSDQYESWLALLILLDQFPRNLYRGEARAWAADGKALRIALSGLDAGLDQSLPMLQRVFAYLPLEHAEDIRLQHRSVALFEALCAQVAAGECPRFEGFLDYARRHCGVIGRFGRFPHRNTALGRASTPDELVYLAQPDAGF
ncbi:MAG: DUF924 family protein [Rhodanobacter sp.]